MEIKIDNSIVIARIKGHDDLTICDNSALFKVGGKAELYDLTTGENHRLFRDVAEYLAIGYFDSLKGFVGKELDEGAFNALYSYLQTSTFKKEFEETYKKITDVTELGKALDECHRYEV